MNVRIKDPGSAITHFIGMMMAMFASTPLLIKAARQPDEIHIIALSIFIASMIWRLQRILVIPCWYDAGSAGGVVKDLQCLNESARLAPIVDLL